MLLACCGCLQGAASAAQGAQPAERTSSYTIYVRSMPVGTEKVVVAETAEGWTITSSGQMSAPVDLVARRVQVRYRPDWTPIDMAIDATLLAQPFIDHTTVADGKAQSTLTQGGQTVELNDAIAPDAVLLPSPFWGPFEALTRRLRTSQPGATLPVYVLRASALVQVGASADDAIQTASELIHVRRTSVKIAAPGAPLLDVELWADPQGRLMRITIPAQNLDVVREDIGSVAARRVVVSREGDEQVRIAANGFTLAGTVSKPSNAGGKPTPAVVLVGGSGPTDRDETVFGIPIFGQLANRLADAGFLVVRYDKRGVGQSGGRPESATIEDYSDDLRAVLKFVSDRKDVDRKRIAVVGHSEGGSVAMLAASRDDRIDALVLAATIGVTGADLNMYQVTHALERSNKNEQEKQTTIDLQKKIQQAVITGRGWEALSPALRRQADTPWFQSFLSFNPAAIMPDIDQPILVVQGELDTQVPPSNADRLGTLANARKKAPSTEVVKVPGVNHLLVPARTGEVDEYASLSNHEVSPAVSDRIASWLTTTFTAIK